MRQAVHSSMISRTPITRGMPAMRMLKLQAKLSCSGVEREELLHELVRLDAALEVDGQLQAGQVGLVAHIGDLADFARLDELGDLVDDGLRRRWYRGSHRSRCRLPSLM